MTDLTREQIEALNGEHQDLLWELENWAKVLVIPSGEAVNDCLRAAIAEIMRLRNLQAPQFQPAPPSDVVEKVQPKFTYGHCEHKKQPRGCPLNNVQCNYPDCDRKPMIRAAQDNAT